MKLVLTVFLFLFICITGGAVHQYQPAGLGNHALVDKVVKEKVSGLSVDVHLDRIYNLDEEDPDFLLREEEDDENIIKTHIRKYYAFFSDIFFPVSFDSRDADTPVCSNLACTNSCKYIVQRVLRI